MLLLISKANIELMVCVLRFVFYLFFNEGAPEICRPNANVKMHQYGAFGSWLILPNCYITAITISLLTEHATQIPKEKKISNEWA